MKITIYGKPDCPYCLMAKDLGEVLEAQGKAEVEYIDLQEQGIDRPALEAITGRPAPTIPQILVNGQYLGGYTEMNKALGGI